MKTILSFKLPENVRSALMSLPINQFRVVELTSLKNLDQEQGDIVLTSFDELSKLKDEMLTRKSLVLYTPQQSSMAEIYAQAKKHETFSVISDADLNHLESILESAYQAVEEKRKTSFPKGKTVGIFSTKGGVGKSFIAYHIAHHLKNFVPGKIVLTDLGLPFGSLKNLLDIDTHTSWQVLRPLLKTGKELTSSRVSAQMTSTTLGFDVLAAPSELTQPPLSAEELGYLNQVVGQTYPLNIVDLPTSITPDLEKYLQKLEVVVMIFSPDSSSFRQVIEFQQFIKQKNVHTQVLYVCNLVEPSQDMVILKSFEKMLGQSILMIELDSEAVKFHQRKFEMFTDETYLLTVQIKELARKLFFTLTDRQ